MANERTYAGGYLPASVPVAQNADGDFVNLQLGTDGGLKISGDIPAHDHITLGYTDGNVTSIVYKDGGAIVAELTLTYDGSNNLTTITKS